MNRHNHHTFTINSNQNHGILVHMSQQTVIERVDVQGAAVYIGDRDDGTSEYSTNGERIMGWLCDGWRYRFNALRSRRYIINSDRTHHPLSTNPDERSVKTMRVECSWIAAMPAMVIQSPERVENTQWFSAIARRKTNLAHHRRMGRLPSFISRKHNDQTFACWHNKGANANYHQVNRNHGIVEVKGQNPKEHREHGTRFTIRIHIRVSQPIRDYTAIRVNWTRRTLSFTNTPLPLQHEPTGRKLGIDVGVAHAATQSDGIMLDLPKHKLDRIDREIRRRQKAMNRKAQASGKSRKQYVKDGVSKRYQHEREQVRQLYAKKKRIITDLYQKYTTHLVKTCDMIAVEALRTANMTRRCKPKPDPQHEGAYLPNGQSAKRKLNRSMLEASPSTLRAMLEYKTTLTPDCTLIEVNPAYTSQTCNQCKHTAAANRESQAVFHCQNCGHMENADINAARNILEAGLKHLRSTDGASHEPTTQDMPPASRGRHAVVSCKPQHLV